MQERISDAELAIMEILWTESPLTATDVAERVTERDWSLATESSLVTGIASALCYFLVVNWVVDYVQGPGG